MIAGTILYTSENISNPIIRTAQADPTPVVEAPEQDSKAKTDSAGEEKESVSAEAAPPKTENNKEISLLGIIAKLLSSINKKQTKNLEMTNKLLKKVEMTNKLLVTLTEVTLLNNKLLLSIVNSVEN